MNKQSRTALSRAHTSTRAADVTKLTPKENLTSLAEVTEWKPNLLGGGNRVWKPNLLGGGNRVWNLTS